MKEPYFCIGTGRCGTQLMSKVFNEATNSKCVFQKSDVSYANMSEILYNIDCEFYFTIFSILLKAVNETDLIYGESSNHLFFLPKHKDINNYFKPNYIFSVRDPIEFVMSALARGFYATNRHHALSNPLTPSAKDPINKFWKRLPPAVKSIWYWVVKNDYIYTNLIDNIEEDKWRVLKFSEIDNIDVYSELFTFLGLEGFNENISNIKLYLGAKVNASPDPFSNIYSVNPFSQRKQKFSLDDLNGEMRNIAVELLDSSITYNTFFK